MKLFIRNILLFFILPSALFAYIFIVRKDVGTAESIKRSLLKQMPLENNLIIMGDSKSLVDLDYTILKDSFPGYHVYNLGMWARNPRYIYSLYKDILEKKHFRNSIIVYNATYIHVLNRDSAEYNSIKDFNLSNLFKILLNGSSEIYNLTNETDTLGFVWAIGQSFGNVKDGEAEYKTLSEKYPPEFDTQIEYLKKTEHLFGHQNKFFLSQLPIDSTVDRIMQGQRYCQLYKQAISENFNKELLFFGCLPEMENSENWFDRDHLNKQGTKRFTPIFCNRLKNKLKATNTDTINSGR